MSGKEGGRKEITVTSIQIQNSSGLANAPKLARGQDVGGELLNLAVLDIKARADDADLKRGRARRGERERE